MFYFYLLTILLQFYFSALTALFVALFVVFFNCLASGDGTAQVCKSKVTLNDNLGHGLESHTKQNKDAGD